VRERNDTREEAIMTSDAMMQKIVDEATRTLNEWADARRAKGQDVAIEEIRVRETTSFYARGQTHRGRFGVQYARATVTVDGKRRNVYAHVSGDTIWGTWRYA
jgi:hypothetical protein